MSNFKSDLIERIQSFETPERAKHRLEVEENRQYLLAHFPKASWPTMELNDYALGQEDRPESFCWAMEFKCRNLGSISGGSASKHIIYFNNETGWAFDSDLGANEQEAWEQVRAGFLQLFEYADAEEWEKVDQIDSLTTGKALRMKALYVYYPDDVLPVNTYAHIQYFLRLLGNPLADDNSGDVVRLNRALLKELRKIPEAATLSNHDLMLVLYECHNPRKPRDNAYALTDEQVEMLMAKFKAEMTDFEDFTKPGAAFRKDELDYKRAVLKQFQDEGGSGRIQELVDEGKGLEALKHLSKIVTSNLVSFQSWRPSFGETEEQTLAVLSAFLEVASKPYEKPSDLAAIFKACKEHNLKPAWDTLSTTLWALRPTDYFPVKISYYRELAKDLGMELPKGRPGPNKFARVMDFGCAFYDALEPYQPNDWVDVQSFMWCVCPHSKQGQNNYWIFQANPNKYDLPAALRSGEKIDWNINQHLKEIKKGDKVILWVTGQKSGCYALATVSSDIYEQEDEGFGPKGVDLEIDLNLVEKPIYKKQLGLSWSDIFKDFNVGIRGTNLTALPKHYKALFELGGVFLENRNYWLYAPGEQAKYWSENQENEEMTIGWDYLGDLNQFQSQKEISNKITELTDRPKPMNDALALWQFYKEVMPGDVIIPKKGKMAYLGYGIVTGEYEFDPAREEFRNIRTVDWKKVGEWKEKGDIVLKTLTNITTYMGYVPRLKKLIGIDDLSARKATMKEPLNKILYGPPGTGKTYKLQTEYFAAFTEPVGGLSQEAFTKLMVSDLAWWQVITMVLLDVKSAKVPEILKHPLMQARVQRANNLHPNAAVWAHLQMHTKEKCPNVNYRKRYDPLMFWKDDESVWTIDKELAVEHVPELVDKLKEYQNFEPGQKKELKRYEFITFHQSYSYEDFVEGIKPVMLNEEGAEGDSGQLEYEIKPGIFKRIVEKAKADREHDYALIIDEINRGNIASIFGELIALIEDDKREGREHPLSAILPYSGEEFSVPDNLHIIGAMNTADRSVEALDTALRRRFVFEEMPPKLEKIEPATVDGVDLRELLGTINARIERLLDKDHCIGHSYFRDLSSLDGLRKAFAYKVLPLLEEYFYNDPARIGMVLGKAFVKKRENDAAGKPAYGPWSDEIDDERILYTVNDPMKLSEEDFQSIYAT